jgi:hypothetical protein
VFGPELLDCFAVGRAAGRAQTQGSRWRCERPGACPFPPQDEHRQRQRRPQAPQGGVVEVSRSGSRGHEQTETDTAARENAAQHPDRASPYGTGRGTASGERTSTKCAVRTCGK